MTTTRTFVSLTTLIKKTFDVVRKDYVVFLPSLLIAFISVLSGNAFQSLFAKQDTAPSAYAVSIVLLMTGLSLLAQAVTILLSTMALQDKEPNIAEAFPLALRRFFTLASLLLISLMAAGTLSMLVNLLPKNIASFLWIPLIFIVMIFFQLFPVVIMLESCSPLMYFSITFRLFKENFQDILRFFLLIAFISLLMIILAAPFGPESTSAALKKIALPLLQGAGSALITIISVVFYLEVKTSVTTRA